MSLLKTSASALRTKMIQDMQLRRFSPNTQECYIQAVVGLAKYYHQSPDQLSRAQVQAYLLYLMTKCKASWGTCDVVAAGLQFFFNVTLAGKALPLILPHRKMPRRLPEILSAQELERLFLAPKNLKHQTLLMTTYAAGLRVSEVVHLRVHDIDNQRMMIRVEQGKGRKDRYTILSPRLLGELRRYWKTYRPPIWLFCRERSDQLLSTDGATWIYQNARKKAGIIKGPPSRYSFLAARVCHAPAGSRSGSTHHSSPVGPLVDSEHHDLFAGHTEATLLGSEPSGFTGAAGGRRADREA